LKTTNDPVLGPCTVLPLYRGPAVLMTAFMALAGPIIVLVWLFAPGAHLDPFLVFCGLLLTLLALFMLPNQVNVLLSPYFAIIGANGFSAFGREPILWRDVAGIEVRTSRGRPVGLLVLLTQPRKLSRTAWLSNIFGLMGRESAPYVFSLPRGMASIPLDELNAMFVEQLNSYRARTTAEPVSPYWPS
jgi:hypothetical protein